MNSLQYSEPGSECTTVYFKPKNKATQSAFSSNIHISKKNHYTCIELTISKATSSSFFSHWRQPEQKWEICIQSQIHNYQGHTFQGRGPAICNYRPKRLPSVNCYKRSVFRGYIFSFKCTVAHDGNLERQKSQCFCLKF